MSDFLIIRTYHKVKSLYLCSKSKIYCTTYIISSDMKKVLFLIPLLVFCLSSGAAFAQSGKAKPTREHLYRVYLTDKAGTPYSLDKPEAFLSKKALERRSRQQLTLNDTDLPVSPKYVKAVEKMGMKVVGCSKWQNTLLVATTDSAAAEQLTALSCVKEVKRVHSYNIKEQKLTRTTLKTTDPTTIDTSYYGKAQANITTINGIPLHEAGYRGKGMTIAIFDGGFMNADVIPLLNNVSVLGTRDFVYPRSEDIFAETDHGTMVLACMGANQPGRIVGTAPEASFYLLHTEEGPYESWAEEDFWTMAAEYADSLGVDIINSSLGYNTFDDKAQNYRRQDLNGRTAFISRTASMLADKGMLLCNSAGNSGSGTWKKIGVPADATDILAVGALTPKRNNASFSSVGPSHDGRVKPDVMSLGAPATVIGGNGAVQGANGTSFASPVLCGMVACLWQALPHLTARQIMALVRQTANNADDPDNVFGYGIADFEKALQAGRNAATR